MLRRSRTNHGGSSFTNLLWLSLLAGAVYFGIMWVPVFAEKYEVRSMLQGIGNENWKPGIYDEEKVRTKILEKAKEVNAYTDIQEGQPRRLGGITLLASDVHVVRDDNAKTLTLQVKYTRSIKYPFLKKEVVRVYSPAVVIDTSATKW